MQINFLTIKNAYFPVSFNNKKQKKINSASVLIRAKIFGKKNKKTHLFN